MKVIYNTKNILIQEFQYSVESQLIEVQIHEMSAIQFVSSMNLVRIQSTQLANAFSERQPIPESRLAEFEHQSAQRM
jgi:hypothetical protein